MSRGLAQGRFDAEADPLFRQLNDSLPFDHRLLVQDIEGSIAWAAAIACAGQLSARRTREAHGGPELAARRGPTNPDLVLQSLGRDEDVHSYVERRLIGDVALGRAADRRQPQ